MRSVLPYNAEYNSIYFGDGGAIGSLVNALHTHHCSGRSRKETATPAFKTSSKILERQSILKNRKLPS